MFDEYPWRDLPEDRVGIAALRERLQELLGQITDRAFPKLRAETRRMLADSHNALIELGPPRQSEREQHLYLAAIAGRFQDLVRAALNAEYSTHSAFESDQLRLITAIVNTTERFNTDFKNSAHTYLFDTAKPTTSTTDQEVDDTLGIGGYEADYCLEEFPDLDTIIVSDWATQKPTNGIMDWIESIYRRSRGVELGTFGPGLLSSAFREQSTKWRGITEQNVSKTILVIHRFILRALEIVCVDARVREEVLSTILPGLLAKYGEGMKQANFLVNVEREKKPYTLNHYFNSTLQKARGLRATESLRSKARTETGKWGQLVVELSSIPSAVRNRSNAAHTKEDIHDILESYYKAARKRFVDNVYRQVVDHCLLSGDDLDTLAVDALKQRKLQDFVKELKTRDNDYDPEERISIKQLNGSAGDAAFTLLYLFLVGEFESPVRDGNVAYPSKVQV